MSDFRLRLPATSANLGAAFDTAAVALDFHLTVEAEAAAEFSIAASGRDAELCGKIENNLILETYSALLRREGRAVTPLALRMDNQIPLGMGCGSSAAGRLMAIALAVHFGRLGWSSEAILEEACAQEGHPDNASACWLGGMVVAASEDKAIHVARVEPAAAWRVLLVMPKAGLATSKARAVLPWEYSRADAVANIQAAALLGLAFAQGRGELLRPAMADRMHQSYRAEICPLLAPLLPLAGSDGVLGVALSGAGPSVLLILDGEGAISGATAAVSHALGVHALGTDCAAEIVATRFEGDGGAADWVRAGF